MQDIAKTLTKGATKHGKMQKSDCKALFRRE